MNTINTLLISLFISPALNAMHIKDSVTKLTFNGEKKTVHEWLRDDRKKEFGKTSLITIGSNPTVLKKTGHVRTMHPNDFKLIAAGFSFYCADIKKKGAVTYGAIVIDPNQHHFDDAFARAVYLELKNNYLVKQLAKENTYITLEDDSQ